LFLLRLANADILPFDYASAAETIDRYLDELQREIEARKLDLDLSEVRRANRRMQATAEALNAEIARILASDVAATENGAYREELARLNDLLVRAEQAFLDDGGLPNRPWFRHQIYAPGYYTGYGVKTLPGVREAIERNDPETARRMAGVLASALERVRKVLVEAIVVAAAVGS
jgi:N-acetylated-alpha-linked acidic dipeptidase